MPTPNEFRFEVLTTVLQELRTENDFVHKKLFAGKHATHAVETLRVEAWVGGRKMAPFVLPGASAIPLPGMATRSQTIQAPNMFVKRPISVQTALERVPGSPFVLTSGNENTGSPLLERMRKDLDYAKMQMAETLEWMCCRALTGTITYAVTPTTGSQPGQQFTIVMGRASGNSITLTTTDQWDEPKATSTKSIRKLIDEMDRTLNALLGLSIDTCIMDAGAADAFMKNEQLLEDVTLLNSRGAGSIDFSSRLQNQGARYLGRVYGVDFWEYSRSSVDFWGNAVPLIASNTAHFFSSSPLAENSVEYGVIPNTGVPNGLFQGELLSWATENEDRQGWNHYYQTRPFPVTLRPDAFFSVVVV